MNTYVAARRAPLVAAGFALLLVHPAQPQTPSRSPLPPSQTRPASRPEPVAETRLLMEGINLPNFRGLEGLLRQRPADVESWTFARGQALLIAENANLLLLRPPRSSPAREVWTDRAANLRTAAVGLARAAGNRDYDRARAGLREVADSCNRCHQAFRVSAQMSPFSTPADRLRAPMPGAPPDRPPLDKPGAAN
jgi:hypothetical protein